MTQAQLADGRILEFPDGTPIEVIQGTVKRVLGVSDDGPLAAAQAAPEPAPLVPDLTGAVPPTSSVGTGGANSDVGGLDSEEDVSIATQEANELLGLDPEIVERGAILPFGKTAEGETVLAVPEIALEVARGILLPGQAIGGTPVTARDITGAALAAGGSATAGLRAVKRVTKAGRITAQQIAEAPTSLDLTKASGRKFTASRQSTATLDPDAFVGFLAGAERDLIEAGIDTTLHPKLTAIFNKLTKKIGDENIDVVKLQNIRRTIGIAVEEGGKDEARIARKLRDNFDDFVEEMPGTPAWKEARKLYASARKLETVETAIIRAGTAASGFENGLRIEFRRLLKNKREMRGFSKEERAAMQAVVDGDFTTNNLKRLGRLGVGSKGQQNFIGLAAGSAGGAAAFGPVGAFAVPAVGQVALLGARRRTQRASDIVRALIGGARPETVTRAVGRARGARAVGGAIAARELETENE